MNSFIIKRNYIISDVIPLSTARFPQIVDPFGGQNHYFYTTHIFRNTGKGLGKT